MTLTLAIIIALAAGTTIGYFLGYAVKTAVLRKWRKRLVRLEEEKVHHHVELLSKESQIAYLNKKVFELEVNWLEKRVN